MDKFQMRQALVVHNTNALYAFINSPDEPGDKESLLEFAVDVFIEKLQDIDQEFSTKDQRDNDIREANQILLSLVHASISPSELGRALYERGVLDGNAEFVETI